MTFETIWKRLSTEALDLLLQSEFVRTVALKRAKKSLYDNFVVLNPENRPPAVQEARCLMLSNLLHTVNAALSDGRIAPNVRKAIIGNFIGKILLGEADRTLNFSKEHRMSPPAFLTISPTKKCNLFCKGCYASSSAGNAETLKYEVFDRVIKEKKDLWGSHFTVISGGEPLLYRDGNRTLFNILEDNQDVYFMMYTNSTLITKETARRMADLGNITPAISVEGFERETDNRRGKGVFKKIMQAMDNLVEFGVPFGISATATRENVDVIISPEFADFYFRQKGAIYGWIFQYMPIGRSYTIDLMITPEQRLELFKSEQRMIRESNLFLVDFWNGGPYALGCISAGRPGGYFYIDWNGNMAPCAFFPYYLSNVYDLYKENRTLNDVLFSPFFESIRKWQNSYGYAQPPEKVDNLITPCIIRDHYGEARKVLDEFNPTPLDEQAAEALRDPEYMDKMREYGKTVKRLTQPLWDEEFANCMAGVTAERPGVK